MRVSTQQNSNRHRRRRIIVLVSILALILFVAVSSRLPTKSAYWLMNQDRTERYARHWMGLPPKNMPPLGNLKQRLSQQGLVLGSTLFMRVFKAESELEVWVRKGDQFRLFATYPICRWSGALGPKFKEGDKQSPEGFYTVSRKQLNPNSRWHRSFNIGFPNAFDRAHNRTGSFIMVHGGCSSIGCFAMTNDAVDDLWTLITASLVKRQDRFAIHVFPFRMTHQNLRLYDDPRWRSFWTNLKMGYDAFERDRSPPTVSVCNQAYAFVPSDRGHQSNAQSIINHCPDNSKSAWNLSQGPRAP